MRGGEPLPLVVEAPTREEALAKLKEQLQARLQDGAELVAVEVRPRSEGNPWVEFAGMFKDDSWIDDWERSMAEYRRKIDENPERP